MAMTYSVIDTVPAFVLQNSLPYYATTDYSIKKSDAHKTGVMSALVNDAITKIKASCDEGGQLFTEPAKGLDAKNAQVNFFCGFGVGGGMYVPEKKPPNVSPSNWISNRTIVWDPFTDFIGYGLYVNIDGDFDIYSIRLPSWVILGHELGHLRQYYNKGAIEYTRLAGVGNSLDNENIPAIEHPICREKKYGCRRPEDYPGTDPTNVKPSTKKKIASGATRDAQIGIGSNAERLAANPNIQKSPCFDNLKNGSVDEKKVHAACTHVINQMFGSIKRALQFKMKGGVKYTNWVDGFGDYKKMGKPNIVGSPVNGALA